MFRRDGGSLLIPQAGDRQQRFDHEGMEDRSRPSFAEPRGYIVREKHLNNALMFNFIVPCR